MKMISMLLTTPPASVCARHFPEDRSTTFADDSVTSRRQLDRSGLLRPLRFFGLWSMV